MILVLLLIYLLAATGLTPGGSSTVHIYTQTTHRTTQLTTLVGRISGIRTQSGQTKINDELLKNYGLMVRERAVSCLQTKINDELLKNYGLMVRERAVSCLCELYPGIYLTTEEKARENLSQGSRRAPVGPMKTEYTGQNIHNNKNT